MNRTRTLLIIGVFMLSLAVLAALEFRVQDEPPSEGQMVTGSLSKDMPALPKLPSLGDSEGNKEMCIRDSVNSMASAWRYHQALT